MSILPPFSKRIKAILILLICMHAGGLFGQVFDMEHDRVQMAELNGLWRFHTGDDPRWSNPAFDDRSWKLLSSTESWSDQGFPGYSGMAWYRFQLIVPAHHEPLGFYCPVETSHQVFIDGKLAGQFGTMPPHARPYDGPPSIILVPASAGADAHPIQIAIRVWEWPIWAKYVGGGPDGPSRIGALTAMNAWRATWIEAQYWSVASRQIQLLIAILAGVAALGFYLLYRLDREYLWFGLSQLVSAAGSVIGQLQFFKVVPHIDTWIAEVGMFAVSNILLITFFWTFFRQRLNAFYWFACIAAFSFVPVVILSLFGFISSSVRQETNELSLMVMLIAVLIGISRGVRRQEKPAVVLIAAIGLLSVQSMLSVIPSVAFLQGNLNVYRHFARLLTISDWPFPFSAEDVTNTLLQLAIIGVLIARFARTRRDEQRLSSELEAARSVQHVMIPEEIVPVPNLEIEAMYRPASEVGGDFFQVLPLNAGSVLIAVGDVSGKGMSAAMTVSLLVGTLRGLARSLDSPSALLQAMNEQLIGRSSGFTTCLLLRIDAGETVTLANAGHLAPYLGARELAGDCELPLGLSRETHYPESTFALNVGEQLTLLTDGIVEARSASGELFGFLRTRDLSGESAHAIAAAAQAFGQEDDMTVLTVRRATVRQAEGSVRLEAVL